MSIIDQGIIIPIPTAPASSVTIGNSAANPVPIQGVGGGTPVPVATNPAQNAIVIASVSGVATAAVTATLAANPSLNTWISGFSITWDNITTAIAGALAATVSNVIGGPLTFQLPPPGAAGQLIVPFSMPLPTTAGNLTIPVLCPALSTAAGTTTVVAYGFVR